ncbi:DUF3618 domain-containing protein [Kribbella sp. NPDC056861]|uniref:DUF3618 domain-containing protein n=1 Tax=Kribbella sp. NPDC056861 TaxID=3154857 RepID=UPI003438E875
MTTTAKNTKMTETEALRADLALTRQHLADTVQELSRQLNVPRRLKESALQVPAKARQNPKATAAVGGALALGVGAAAWIVGRGK